MVDAADRERIAEAGHELRGIIDDEVLVESNVPILVLANKIDYANAMGETDLVYRLGLYHELSGKTKEFETEGARRKIELFTCSLKHNQGYGSGFRWLAQYL